MKDNLLKILISCFLFVTLASCLPGARIIDKSDLLRAKSRHKGTSRIYPVNIDQAYEIAKKIFLWVDATSIEEYREENYIFTKFDSNLLSYGSLSAVWVKEIDQDHTNITAISKSEIGATGFSLREKKSI